MTEQPQKPRGHIPLWLALLVIAVVAGGGLWAVLRLANQPEQKLRGDDVVVLDDDSAPTGKLSEGLYKHREGRIIGRIEDILLTASPSERKPDEYYIYLNYLQATRDKWLTSEQQRLHLLLYRILESRRTQEYIDLTREQRLALLKLDATVRLSDGDRKRLESAVVEWDKATGTAKAEARAAVLRLMYEIGSAHREPSKEALQKRVAGIAAVLSAEQIRKASAYKPPPDSWWPSTRPSSKNIKPSTRPTIRQTWGGTTRPSRSTTRPAYSTTRPVRPSTRPAPAAVTPGA